MYISTLNLHSRLSAHVCVQVLHDGTIWQRASQCVNRFKVFHLAGLPISPYHRYLAWKQGHAVHNVTTHP